jgi:hypothetical protein
VPEITADQVHDLLTATQEFIHTADAATKARDALGHLFLDVVLKAKVGLKDLSAVTGLHHATIRAAIQRAVGPGLPDGWEQPSLLEFFETIEAELPDSRPRSLTAKVVPLPPPNGTTLTVVSL